MKEEGVVRRRNLPHIDVEDKPSFITACLQGSISSSGFRQIENCRKELESKPRPEELSESEWRRKKHQLLFDFVDSILDGQCPARHLADDRLAEIVQNAFLHFAEVRYHLYAFVVMPSHHHWLFLPNAEWAQQLAIDQAGKMRPRTPRESISHSIQSYTANQCNRVREKTGAFWQTESFDHYVRDEAELFKTIHYIEQNPVAAGLVKQAEDFRWSSARLRKELGLHPGDPIPHV